MYPQTSYAHAVVSVETFVGLFFSASMLGLIFARVSRPRARLLFTKFLTVGPYEGQRTLFMRVANARLNIISSATARLWVLVSDETAEGVTFRRFLEMKLVRSENPTFVLSWTILHSIDETSPLFGRTPEDLTASDAFFILSITRSRRNLSADRAVARNLFSRATSCGITDSSTFSTIGEDGSSVLDYERFHDVEPLAGADVERRPADPADQLASASSAHCLGFDSASTSVSRVG